MPVATGDAFRYVTTSGTNVGENDATLIAPDVNGTLTIVGGFGITLTADAVNRKITITNTGNGSGALTTITTQNSAGTYYPVFTSGGASPTSTLYYETTTNPLTYNPGTGTLNVQNLVLGGAGTIQIDNVTSTGVTGTGNLVFGSNPTLVTPTLGAATATSINKIALTAVATGATITATDGTTITLPSTTGTVALNNQTFYLGSTQIAINRTTGSLALTGITSIDGYAGSIAGGAIGYIPYQSAANTTLFVAGNTTTTPQFLTSTGTGSAAQAPTLTSSTGSGSVVLATSPSLTTPILGVATATSINKMAITAPATSSTLAVADGKTFTVSNTITLAGTDSTTITLPSTTGTVPLNNQTFYLGTTSVAINRASANLALTGISSIALPGSVSGTSTLQPQATAGTTTFTLPTTTGTLVGTGDSATVSNTMLANSSFNIGTTSITLGRASANLALTGISSVAFPGSTSGTAILQATATAGTPTLSLPITTGTLIGTGDSATVTNTMLANTSVTFGSTSVALGATSTTLAGLTSIDGTTGLTSAFATPNGTVALLGAATTLNLANTATSLSIGNTATAAQTVNLFTASTGNSFYYFATGATTSGNIKTINIGTGGLASSTTNVTLGATTGTSSVTVNGSLTASTSILLKGTGGIGYATGSGYGGTITQTGSRTGAVTVSYITGAITLFAAAPTVGTYVTFTVTNTTVAATDTVIINFKSSTNTYIGFVSAVGTGSFNITFASVSGTASDSPVINFAVIKGSAN